FRKWRPTPGGPKGTPTLDSRRRGDSRWPRKLPAGAAGRRMKAALLLALALTACVSRVPTLPKVAEDATYELHTPHGQCTAWAVDDHHLITAGHCCDDEGSYFAAQPGRSLLPVEVVMGVDVDYEAQAPVDICLLKTEAFLPAPLALADKMPQPGDPVGFVGYPGGKWTHSKGVYVGDIDGP